MRSKCMARSGPTLDAIAGGAAPAIPRGEIVEIATAGRPGLGGLLLVPEVAAERAPLLVAVHGISRNAREQIERFAPLARRHGYALVAPCFPERSYRDYQRLGRRGHGERADLALAGLIDELGRLGLASGELFLFGYSGGGQFVHRYVMAHPENVSGAVVSAAGWYTFPDPSVAYPYGLRVDGELPGVRFRPRAFLRVPMLALVGEEDRQRDENLRRSRALDRQQGRTRVARARRWARAMRRAARARDLKAKVRFAVIDGVGHSFEHGMDAGLGELVFDFLDGRKGPSARDRTGGPGPSGTP